ncbi:MAG: lipopolysaccharide heptosyltransferase II [Deltaproteobacteria bacterium]|nr:lipopolysaccharide heptosyltransferase II [Deltaproteobacteria bacterium]MBN2687704.1 lipopolysaccharide heptosyltransferase II [Deltaproteobacteria bacterium]
MRVRRTKPLIPEDLKNILIRGTNWIGDVVMTLPAVAAIRETCPGAKISVLAKPWVAELYRICGDVDAVIPYERMGDHKGTTGIIRLAREIRKGGYDGAILLQNAIEAAIITWLAGIPIRGGYNSDGRGLLLTHSVRRTKEVRTVHQIHYYLEMVKALGFTASGVSINLAVDDACRSEADGILRRHHVERTDIIVGIAPGATYGPAKMWFPDRFAAVADALADEFSARIILFGSEADRPATTSVQEHARHHLISLAGETTLKEAIAAISRCDLFISNDSGLMHLAGALDIPLVAIFGSTNPRTTSPVGDRSVIVHRDVSCSPCLKKVCPTDFRCMEVIGVHDVYHHARMLLADRIGRRSMNGGVPSA